MPVEALVPKFAVKPMDEREHEIFLSHCQTSGQDQTGKINSLLEARGLKPWCATRAVLRRRSMHHALC